MLSRRLIMEHGLLVIEGLMLRSLGVETKEAIIQVHALGQKVLQAQKEKEELQQERNSIAEAYKNGGNKVELQECGSRLKGRLVGLETYHKDLEEKIHSFEVCIPNIPEIDVPIPRKCWEHRGFMDEDLSYEEYVSYKRSVLGLLKLYIDEYNQ